MILHFLNEISYGFIIDFIGKLDYLQIQSAQNSMI